MRCFSGVIQQCLTTEARYWTPWKSYEISYTGYNPRRLIEPQTLSLLDLCFIQEVMKQSILPEKKFLVYRHPQYFPWEQNLSKMPEIFERDLNCAGKHYIDCELSLSSGFSACHFYLNANINEDLNVPFYYCPLFSFSIKIAHNPTAIFFHFNRFLLLIAVRIMLHHST